jgi:hypothetical protein
MGTAPRRAWQGGIPAPLQRSVLFLSGLGLVIHEAVIRTQDARWPLLVIYAGMMGLPLALRADDLRRALEPPPPPEGPE